MENVNTVPSARYKRWGDGEDQIDRQVPSEPTLTARAIEALKYLEDIHDTFRSVRGILLGEGELGEKAQDNTSSLEGLVANICQRAACLSGEAKTILARL